MKRPSCYIIAAMAVQSLAYALTSEDSGVKQVVHHGIIREDASDNTEVKLDVPLGTDSIKGLNGKEICGYTIYKTLSYLPFRIVEVDRITGAARIVVARGAVLDYEKRHQYNFEIAAHDCETGNHARREAVHVEVEDVNEFTPTWRELYMTADVVEGRVYDYIKHIQAVDRDGADGVSRICRYHIVNDNVPFDVDADGYVRNTEPLSYDRQTSYTLELKADDCDGRVSDTAILTVNVRPLCQPGWTGLSDRVEFIPRDGRRLVAASAELETCAERCNISHATVTVKLTTEHIGKGCDRDTYSLESQRRLCGASDSSIDLLPNPLLAGSWTKDLPTDDGHESDQIFAFDGKTTAIEVPSSKLQFDVGARFTLSTWMKHDSHSDDDDDFSSHRVKEHILCHSDGDGMNRHHYALFIRNCHLVLLLRQEPSDTSLASELQPAEWRWEIPQVCDNKWHHYAVSVESLEARLYIDGQQFADSHRNPHVVDDWPLHLDERVHFTKHVIGACWQGGKHRMTQHLRGYLAGLSLLNNKTEDDRVISCLNQCQEKLDINAVDTKDDTSVSINSARTTIVISSRYMHSVQTLLHRIGYVNTRTFPTPGHRPISIETSVECSDGHELSVPPVKTLVMVVDAERPTITLRGIASQAADVYDLSHGTHLFPDLVIDATTKTEHNELNSDSTAGKSTSEMLRDRLQLDSCLIRVEPQLALAFEHIRPPHNLISHLGLDVDFSEDGLVIAGAKKLSLYEEVLRQVRYVNNEAQELNSRTFVLTCTELNGRFVSNKLETTLVVVRTMPSPAPAHVASDDDRRKLSQMNLPHGSSHVQREHLQSSQTGVVVAVVLACVGFVVVLVALGVRRVRNAGRHSRRRRAADMASVSDDRQEMEWDNSALTITVNPMDQQMMYSEQEAVMTGLAAAGGGAGGLHMSTADSDDSDDDDDDEPTTLHQDDEDADSSDDNSEQKTSVRTRELEWDDSTLSY